MAFESSSSKEIQRPKKIGSASTTKEHGSNLESFLVASKVQTTSSLLTINHCRSLRKDLKTLISFAPTNNYCRGLREGLETLISPTPTNNYCRGLRKGLEIFNSFAPTNNNCRSFTKGLEASASFTPTINHCHGLRKGLETQLMFITSTSFVRSSNIPDIISSSINPAKTSYTFWHRHCWHSGI